MANPYIPREIVHTWSETIGESPEEHASSLTRLLKVQRRLGRFIEENRENLEPTAQGVTTYLVGVVARMFELAGGRLKKATWAQVREAEARVQQAALSILPYDEGFAERLRALEWRAQPHILDEAYMALFVKEDHRDEEVELDPTDSLKVFFLLWVAVEVLDGNWRPAKDYAGESEYAYVHIEP